MLRYYSSILSVVLLGATASFAQNTVPLNQVPSRIVGHPNPEQNGTLTNINPNLVEGRELYNPGGIALDTSVSPPILYVADSLNNRVLAWKNATTFTNGQAADLVIGQSDFFRTRPSGPGTTFSTFLYTPSGLTVSSNGDLYIADTSNNRVLRFKKPFVNAGNLFPDLYIGQPSLSSNGPNYPTTLPDKTGLKLAGYRSNLAFDTNGNLWVTDPGNHRVLRFRAADLAGSGGPLSADLEIGQPDFTTNPVQSATAANPTTANLFAIPSAIAFDSSGRLYVSDSDGSVNLNRVLVYDPKVQPFSNGMAATRMMGVFPPNLTTQPSDDQKNRTLMTDPEGIFFIPGKVGVLDGLRNRILLFDTYDKWPDITTSYSPQATNVVGQLVFNVYGPNGGSTFVPAPSNSTVYYPTAAVVSGTELFLVDSGNNRVLVMPLQSGTIGAATRVLGQYRFDMMAPNLIEGREFDFTNGTSAADAGIAVDATGDTPHLYVADTYNNRVLGYNDFRKVKAGDSADIVIGQADLNSGLCNGNGDPNHQSAANLCYPTGLLVDASGNLYVADTSNGRVLRFPTPFAHQGSQQADLVLGQHNMTSKIIDPTPFTMSQPYGLAFAGTSGLLVSDIAHNRVLLFSYTNGVFDANADSGKAASLVLGQPDFNSITTGTGDSNLSNPHHLAADTEGRPYVVDTGNNRVVIFDSISNLQSGSAASLKITGLNSPRGIFVNQTTGEVWVTNTNSGTVLKFPRYQSLAISQATTGGVLSAGATLAVAQDQFGNLLVADSTNRVGLYFPGLQAINGGNFIPTKALAPGVLASICSPNSTCDPGARVAYLGLNTSVYTDLPNPIPIPNSLGDVQVLFDGVLAPLYYVSPSQINLIVPMSARTTGTADVVVFQPSTGRIYAAGPVNMTTSSPAVLTTDFGAKTRQAAVINQDNSINSPSSPAPRGSVISIYATGQGFVPNAPPDGTPPSSLITTPFTPRILLTGIYVDEYIHTEGDPPANNPAAWIQFSGLSQYPGLWQINVHIPGATTIGAQILTVNLNSNFSNDASSGYQTMIYVK